MNLVIDIGNSQTKFAVFERKEIRHTSSRPEADPSLFQEVLQQYPIKNAILSSVRKKNVALHSLLEEQMDLFIDLNANTALPFENLYLTRETLGKDRLAAIAGAADMFPGDNVAVFDLGTAITIDVITRDKQYLGGNISPGMQMRFSALHTGTDNLPFLVPKSNDEEGIILSGHSTSEAIRSGVITGIFFEVQEYLNQLSVRYDKLKIVFTGGDADFFVRKLKNHIFVDSNLNLKGLNRILKHNEDHR